jgi:hypothetical protein
MPIIYLLLAAPTAVHAVARYFPLISINNDRTKNCPKHINAVHLNGIHKGYSESNLRLFWATNVGVGESSCMRGSVTWLIALQTIT